jgi:DNA-binding MarR family transcriptional regulator
MKSLEEQLLELFPLIGRKLFKSLKKHHVNSMNHRILFMLDHEDGHSMSHYGHKLDISRPNFTKAVRAMIDESLVETKQDSEDRRKHKIYITDDGKKVVKMMKKDMLESVKDKLKPLSDEKKKELLDHIKGIQVIMEELED